MRIVGRAPRSVKAIVLASALLALPGCFWRSYGARIAMHTSLLVSMAHKGVDLVRARAFAPENLPELHYPLERAAAYAQAARRHAGDRPPASLAAFETLLVRYATFCQVADDARRTGPTRGGRDALRRAEHDVRDAARAVRSALAREGRGAG